MTQASGPLNHARATLAGTPANVRGQQRHAKLTKKNRQKKLTFDVAAEVGEGSRDVAQGRAVEGRVDEFARDDVEAGRRRVVLPLPRARPLEVAGGA